MSSTFKQQLLRSCAMDFVEICYICASKASCLEDLILVRFVVAIVISILVSLFYNTVYFRFDQNGSRNYVDVSCELNAKLGHNGCLKSKKSRSPLPIFPRQFLHNWHSETWQFDREYSSLENTV